MEPEKLIYTDGRDVVVTDSVLRVRKTTYSIDGITKLYFRTIRPERWPAIVLLLTGLLFGIVGFLNLVPETMDIQTRIGYLNANTAVMWGGVILFALGLLALLVARERYAVRIGTAEGEKNAVVSRKRDYIAQIVDAVHTAFDTRHLP